jgi:hypothetical protein
MHLSLKVIHINWILSQRTHACNDCNTEALIESHACRYAHSCEVQVVVRLHHTEIRAQMDVKHNGQTLTVMTVKVKESLYFMSKVQQSE